MPDAIFARLPRQTPDVLTLNFQGGADDIPTYSFADLYACVSKGDKDFFKRNFGGKIVLIGTVLDVEDRKITSKRFATAPEGARAERCALPIPVASQKFARDSIAGVYIHATAVNNLVRNDGLTEFGRIGAAIASFALAILAAAAALAFGPAAAAAATVGLGVTWTASATVALRYALALPLTEPLIASLAALVATIGYRFVIADRGKRLLRQSFALYLAPAVIEKMLSSNKPPALGGEMRNVTIYFSDIADFSSIAEKIPPTELVAAMNEYLSAMTDVIEAHGGFVDKYFGDAIVAVFGAPLDDKDHATNAVRAALRCAASLATLDRVNAAFGGAVRQRIGLNSGEALVGNIGSRRRFNYTVMGDVVNLASRLEGSNKLYGTTIIASEATVTLTGRSFVWRELDAIRVKGRRQAVRIFEPLGVAGQLAPELLSRAQAYGAGLTRYRARDFAGAAEKFALVANDDTPSALFLERVRQLAQQPPGADWEAVSAQEEK
jgi:class 3 adenylate cyclase